MSSQSLVKTYSYVSRGVQTADDHTMTPSQFSSLCEIQTLVSSDDAPVDEPGKAPQGSSSENFRTQLLGTLAYESAYIQSKTSEHSELLPLLSYKNKKYAGVGGFRRAVPIVVQKRTASLPDLPPQIEVLTERNTRIVSMPEFTKCLTSDRPTFYQTNASFSTDGSQSHNNSLDSPVQRWQLCHDKNYPCDLPQTPSPPSSPDSVVIIGNEPHVSGSFLRRSSAGDDGWVTWASSPPRPIPALHGPLSLPYARCPSGAEGTVIEGDDLSHKIWGLGVGDLHAHTMPYTGRVQSHQPPQPTPSGVEFIVPCLKSGNELNQDIQYAASLQRQRDAVIDLSRPSTFYNCNGTSRVISHLSVKSSRQGSQPYISFPIGSGETQSLPPSDGLKIDHVNNHLPNSSMELLDDTRKRFDISEPRIDNGTRSFGGNAQNRLNKSAPIFVPGADWQAKDGYIQYERDGYLSDTRLSQRVDSLQQRHNEFISPPSTASPNWSPVFPHFVDLQMSNMKAPRHIQDISMYTDPRIYSPASDAEDYSTKLMAMIQQFKSQEFVNIAKRYPIQATKQAAELPMRRKVSVAAAYMEHTQAIDEGGSIRVPSDFRRDLSQQHPRSIPLARLIQRRLSSVAEEVGTGNSSATQSQADLSKQSLSLEPLNHRPALFQQELRSAAGVTEAHLVMQPAETMEDQPADGDSNAIVRLPRKGTPFRLNRSSSGSADSKRPPRHESRTEKRSIINPEERGTSEMASMKGRNGKAKKSEVALAKEASG